MLVGDPVRLPVNIMLDAVIEEVFTVFVVMVDVARTLATIVLIERLPPGF